MTSKYTLHEGICVGEIILSQSPVFIFKAECVYNWRKQLGINLIQNIPNA